MSTEPALKRNIQHKTLLVIALFRVVIDRIFEQ
jgi:hypothetical protein